MWTHCVSHWCTHGMDPSFACAADVVTEAEQGQILRVVPEREGHRADLQWAVPPEQAVYRAAPCAYLGHLIGCAQAVQLKP